MGQAGSHPAIADAGPLIHLHEIGRLSLIGMFAAVHIPSRVWSEVVDARRVPAEALGPPIATQLHQVRPGPVLSDLAPDTISRLHAGEIECLHLCRYLSAPLLLTDDLAAREAAHQLSIRPVGSLGVVVRAFYRGDLSLVEAEDALDGLYRVSTLFVTRTIIDLALEQLHRP